MIVKVFEGFEKSCSPYADYVVKLNFIAVVVNKIENTKRLSLPSQFELYCSSYDLKGDL